MALTTHEKIRLEAGFQSRFVRQSFKSNPGSGATTFYVKTNDNVKFVPEFGTGGTIAGISDVQVWLGLSGINGSSRLNISIIDIDQGAVTLTVAPDTGSSLTINYSSSAIPSLDIEQARLRAESMISQRLSLCYDLPVSPIPSVLEGLASRLSSALLLIRGFGTGSADTAADGYRLYELLMGNNQYQQSSNSPDALTVGEVG